MVSNQFLTNVTDNRQHFEFFLDKDKNLCFYAEEGSEELINIFVKLDKEDVAVLLKNLKALYKEM